MKKHGVLLAISSLPGKYGIGDFSIETIKFIKILKKFKVDVWQILPLNPIGYGHSPYQPFSSYAIDEIYISLEDLQKRGLIRRNNLVRQRSKVNYEVARKIKENAISKAFENFKQSEDEMTKLRSFVEENPYVKEYAEFVTLKEMNNNRPWNEWNINIDDVKEDFEYIKTKHEFAQMILFEEWNKIRDYANKNNIEIIGDVPFYVGYDSSDVYFHKEAFMLDEKYNPTCVAGVPPDYFSKTGQRWGNPIWNWEHLYKNNFKEMMDRLVFASKLFDIVRIDHFRAFDSYWSISPDCLTAIDGEWKFPNGELFFKTLFEKYPDMKIIAEDLGELRPEVYTLRDEFKLAGMRVIQFHIFDDLLYGKNQEKENQLIYTGTHDNETLNEWVTKLNYSEKKKLLTKLNELEIDGENLVEKLIRYTLKRKEQIAIVAAQDLLNLNKTHRMNIPGEINDFNWRFKITSFNKISRAIKKYFC